MESIKRFDFTTILGWSVSRYDKFSMCQRQYYYNYYAKFDHEFSREKIDYLKRLTSIPLEIGNIVHDIVKILLERLLKSEQAINSERFYRYARQITLEYCSSKIFSELFYHQRDRIDPEQLFEEVRRALKNFLESDRFAWLMTNAVKQKADWIIEPPGFGETRIEEMKAYCKVDFLFPAEGKLFILDWKTGKVNTEKHKNQLIGYSLWATHHFHESSDNIVPIVCYLSPAYKEMEIEVKEKEISDFSLKVRKETEIMYSFCKNIEENIPKDKEEFVQTDNKRICAYCNFRELCQR